MSNENFPLLFVWVNVFPSVTVTPDRLLSPHFTLPVTFLASAPKHAARSIIDTSTLFIVMTFN